MSDKGRDFFGRKTAESYDERFRKISPIRTNVDFVIGIVLDDLPAHSRLLCVGVGTGTEIVELASANPHCNSSGWSHPPPCWMCAARK